MNSQTEVIKELQQLLERAWGLIANAGGGNWKTQSRQWETTAEKWRDDWIKSAPDSAPPHIGEAWRKAQSDILANTIANDIHK
jgi:hypothetical protein